MSARKKYRDGEHGVYGKIDGAARVAAEVK
jgi:hypothetical protein